MPHLSQRLTLRDFPDNPNPVEFGTIIIFTCSKSCWQEGDAARNEHVIVQMEMI